MSPASCSVTPRLGLADSSVLLQAKGVDISKLAMRYTLSEESIPTTLVSTASIARLKSNVAYVTMTLTEEEQKVSDELMAKFFLWVA